MKNQKLFKIKQIGVICWYCEKEITEFALEYHNQSPWKGSANIVCKKCAKGMVCLK